MSKDGIFKDSSEENELIRKVYHTDARVTAMEGQLSSITAGMGRIEAKMMEQPETNYLSWFLAIAAVMFGVAQYVELVNDPIRALMAQRNEPIVDFREFKQETHYEMGKIHEWKNTYDWDKGRAEDRAAVEAERLREAEAAIASLNQKVEDNERQLKDIDSLGSRRWTDSQPK